MKGLILAAGLGTRLRPITSLRPKPTIKVANQPLIHYSVLDLLDAGVSDIGVVVSPDTIEPLREALEPFADRANIEYVIQDPPLGLAHAVQVSREYLGDDPFVMYLSDNLFEHGIRDFVDAFRPEQGVNAVLALVRVDDPRSFGVARIEEGRVVDLVEKPADPPSNLAVAGVYVFDASIHEALEGLEPGAKGEYQITDGIQRLLDRDLNVAPVELQGWWKDTGKPEDILDANRLLLQRLRRDVAGTAEESELTGDVVLEEGATVRRSRILGPALIAAGTVVEDAYVGPFTAVAPDVTLRAAEIEYSVVGARTRIEGVRRRIQGSLIGEDVTICDAERPPADHQLTVGDKSRVVLARH